MQFVKEIKNIKARKFLHQEIDENEIFSIAINAKNRSDQNSFDEAMKLLSKPLSKQSNILLLELFRISIKKNDSKLAIRLLKILLRKTNQSFVIHTVLNLKNSTLRAKLIEDIKQNKKLEATNRVYLYFRQWEMNRIPRKLLVQEINKVLKNILLQYQFDIYKVSFTRSVTFDERDYLQNLNKRFLLELMNGVVLLAKIGCSGKAVSFFKKGFYIFKGFNTKNHEQYFKNSSQGWGNFHKERRFTDGTCNFDDITQYLDTDFKAFFTTPFNQNELEVAKLRSTNALNFANEFAKYSINTHILKTMFSIQVSQGFLKKNIFGYIPLIERVNKKDFDQDWAEKINNYFLNTHQHYFPKVAFLGLSKQVREKINIDENKIKDLFTNKVIKGKLSGLFDYSNYKQKIEYYGGCTNSIAFKFIYERADKEIREWLEDLYIAKKLTQSNGEFYENNYERRKVVYFKKMFSTEIGENFDQNIKIKIDRLIRQDILSLTNSSGGKSVDSACFLLKDARNSGDFSEAIKFLKGIKLYSGKKVYYKSFGKKIFRKDYVIGQCTKDYLGSKIFKAEMSKFFQVFLKLSLKDQREYFPYNNDSQLTNFILPYCDKKTFSKYLHQNPYCMFRSLRSQTVLESVRIKKGIEAMRSMSNKNFKKDYRKYVSNRIKDKDSYYDEVTKMIYFLEEAERRYSVSCFKNRLEDDFNQIPNVLYKVNSVIQILKGAGTFFVEKKPNQAVEDALNDLKNKFIDEIRGMSVKELENIFDADALSCINIRDFRGLYNFLLKKIPLKIIPKLVDTRIDFSTDDYPGDGVDKIFLNSALRRTCNALKTTNTFHWENTNLAKAIFKNYEDLEYMNSFEYWDNESMQIIDESVAPIYQNMANFTLKGLKILNFKNKKQAQSFDKCISCITSIGSRDLPIKGFRKRHIKIYFALETAASQLLQKSKISKLTGETFLNLIDHLFGLNQDTAKEFLGNAKFKQFKIILKNCALHIIKVNEINVSSNKNLYLHDSELKLEIMKNYLQSMDTFDPEYKRALNNLPLSKEIVQYSRKYNAPYWANSLNLYS